MVSNLPSALDNLASAGIIDFDADAYIKGTPPRYVGNPESACLPFDQPLPAFPPQHGPAPQLPAQPKHDEFVVHKEENGIPSWKKALAAVLVAGVAVFAGIKHKDKLTAFLKKTWTGIKNFAKSKPAPPPPPPPKAKSWFAKIPTWAKITGGSLLGLVGLVGAFKFLSSAEQKKQ